MIKRKTVSIILQIVIFIGLAIFLIYWQMGRMNAMEKESMFAAIRSANLWLLPPVIVVGFFSHYFRALRWNLLLEPLNIKPTKANTFFAVMIGYLVNSFLPRVGEVAKCTVLAKYEKVPADKMVGTIVSERAFDLVCLLIVIFISIIFQVDVIGAWAGNLMDRMREEKGHTLLYVVIGIVLLIVLMPVLYRSIRKTKVGHAIKGIGDGVKSIMHMKRRWLFLAYTFGIWGGYMGMIILGFRSMPATAHLGPLVALTVLAFGSISMIITPGGFAAYPIFVGAILELYAVSNPEGTAFGWVAWIAQTAVIIVLGIISLILLPIYNRTTHDAQAAMDPAKNI